MTIADIGLIDIARVGNRFARNSGMVIALP